MEGSIMKEIREGAASLTEAAVTAPDTPGLTDIGRKTGGFGNTQGDPLSIIDSIIMDWK